MQQSKPFDNKPKYDPGRFRYTLDFRKQTSVPDGAGGTTVVKASVKEMKAIRLPLHFNDQLAIEAGASLMKESCYFVIRTSPTFIPSKDMNVLTNGAEYVIKAIVPEGEPVKYFRILATKKDG